MDGSGRWLSRKANMCAIGILNLLKSRWCCSDLVSTFWVGSNCIIIISFYAGFLSLDVCYRPGDFQVYGLRIVWCSITYYVLVSCDSNCLERSCSFSLSMVLPIRFYMVRFFKEKTFLVLTAFDIYSGNDDVSFADVIHGLDCVLDWICFEVLLKGQDYCLKILKYMEVLKIWLIVLCFLVCMVSQFISSYSLLPICLLIW